MSPLTIEQQLTKHELEDQRRFGQMETHLTRIEGKIDVLAVQILEARKVADSATDLAEDVNEKTGSYKTAEATKSADFWKRLIAGVIASITIAIGSGLVTYFVSHR